MKKKIFVITVALLLLTAWKMRAQTCTTLTGKVVSSTGEILPGANIRPYHTTSRGTSADTEGKFELIIERPDSLIVSFIGFEEKVIPHTAQGNCYLDVVLYPTSQRMDELVIKAERLIAEEFTTRKIRKLEIYTNPSAKADPILAVNSSPSATTTDESANISLRGGSPAETGIFFNNVPINDAVRYSQLNGIGTFSIFNTALVNSVLVYPGNPPLEYGNSTSGLIALHTDENIPNKNSHTASLTLASFGFYTSNKLTSNSSLSVFSNYQPSVLIRALNSNALKNLRAFTSIDLGIHYLKKISDKTLLKVFNYSVFEKYEYINEHPTYTGIFHQRKVRNFTVANIRKRFRHTEISFNQGLSFSKGEYQYSTTDIKIDLLDLFSSFNIHHTGTRLEWKTGISYDHKKSDFNGTFPRYDYAVGEIYPTQDAVATQSIKNPELYGYTKYNASTRWILGAGFRKNLPLEKLRNYLSVQANIHFKPNEDWKINFSGGKYYKYQLPQGESNSPLIIFSKQYSLDVMFTRQHTETSLSIFNKRTLANTVKTKLNGVELYIRQRIDPNIRFQFSLTCLDARQNRNEKTEQSLYDIHYFVRGNIEYKIQGTWTITAVFLCRQGSFYRSIQEVSFNDALDVFEPVYNAFLSRLPSYSTVDMSISKILLLKQETTAIAFLSVGNVGNFRNVHAYTYNFDYTAQKALHFSLRAVYFGLVLNF